MKILFVSLFILFFPIYSFALEEVTDVYLKERFSENIRRSGNPCFRCINVYLVGKGSEGTTYRVMCNNGPTSYTVIVSPTEKYTVKLW